MNAGKLQTIFVRYICSYLAIMPVANIPLKRARACDNFNMNNSLFCWQLVECVFEKYV